MPVRVRGPRANAGSWSPCQRGAEATAPFCRACAARGPRQGESASWAHSSAHTQASSAGVHGADPSEAARLAVLAR